MEKKTEGKRKLNFEILVDNLKDEYKDKCVKGEANVSDVFHLSEQGEMMLTSMIKEDYKNRKPIEFSINKLKNKFNKIFGKIERKTR